MASSLLDRREIVHLLRWHLATACTSVVVIGLCMDQSAAISTALSYGLFLLTWVLSAYYAFRFQGAQHIKAILLGFYVGGALKLTLTLLTVALLIKYWPAHWLKINWLVFLLVMLLSYLASWLSGLFYYRRRFCG